MNFQQGQHGSHIHGECKSNKAGLAAAHQGKAAFTTDVKYKLALPISFALLAISFDLLAPSLGTVCSGDTGSLGGTASLTFQDI